MILVNITSTKAHLSSLLKQLEEDNEEIIIERAGRPIAKILKYTNINNFNRLGIFKNKISISNDFDQWSEDIATNDSQRSIRSHANSSKHTREYPISHKRYRNSKI